MSKLKELREERARLHSELSQVLAGADSSESREKAKKLIAAMDEKAKEITAIESKGLSAVGNGLASEKDVEFRRAFANYLRKGENRLNDAERAIMEEKRDGIVEGAPMTGHIGTYTGLGYFVPSGFVYDVETALKFYAPLLNGGVFTVMDTASGQPLPYPTNNDTTNTAALVGESSVVSEEDVTAGQIIFAAYKYTSGLIKASIELIQDSAFPLESWLAERFAVRFGRKFEDELTNGNGSSKPTGLLQAISNSGASPTVAAGSATNSGGSETGANSIGTNDIVNLIHSVDPAYRRNGKFMAHDTTIASLQKILDKFGRPIWTPGIQEGEPDRLFGYPIVTNQAMPQIGASNVTMAFGDMSKYLVRRVKDFSVLTLRERYAEYGQVGYLGFMRVDGNLLDAGTHPIKLLQQTS